MNPSAIKHLYQFGPFRLDVAERLLWREGELVSLPPKVLDTLVALVRNSDRVLPKDELMKTVWPDTFVEENNLNQNISLLRKTLGEREQGVKYIETIPRRGYRFASGSADEWRELPAASDPVEAPATSVVKPALVAATRPFGLRGFALLLAIAFVAAGYIWFARRRPVNKPVATPKSIAVLPFKLLGDNPGDEYLGLGMADILITRLGANHRVIVRPTSAVRKYATGDQDLAAAGRQLGVDALVEGTIHRSGDRVRVTVRLVNPLKGALLWADKFDERFSDIFRVEDSIAEKVARSLTPELTGGERVTIGKRYTENPEAYRLYMIGRYHYGRTDPTGWHKAVAYFRAAIEKDPNYALAYAGLADTYVALAASELPQAEAMPQAKEAALRALKIDPDLAEVHIAAGRVKQLYDWDWDGAEEEFARAIQISPNMADAHREYGAYLVSTGRHEQGIAEMRLAREMDPISLFMNFEMAWALLAAHRDAEAIPEFRKIIAMDPGYSVAHQFLGQAYEYTGLYDDAITELQTAVRLSADSALPKADLGHAYALAGKKHQALELLSELLQRSKHAYVSPYAVAIVYAGIGDKDHTFEWLEKAYGERSRRLVGLGSNRAWDGVREDPRFADLMKRMRTR